MNYRLMLLGSTATYAPDTDDGAAYDQDDGQGGDDIGDDGQDGEEDDEFDDPDDQDDEPPVGDDLDDPDGEPPQRRQQQSRGERRVQTLANQVKELQRQLAERTTPTAPTGPQQTPEQIAAERQRRLDGMTAEQRLQFQIEETRTQTQAQLNEIRFATWDTSDKAGFDAQCASNPALRSVAKEVEQELATMRRNGQNVPRENLALFLIGKKALAKSGRARSQGQRREQDGRDRHEARPGNGRGDVPRGDRRQMSDQEARRKRLEGMKI